MSATLMLAVTLSAGELVVNTDTSDPAPKKAFQYLISEFEKANPDVKVKWNIFDHEGYKTSIRNFLAADAPDVAAWYAGNRMAPFVNAGLFEDVSDVWASNGLNDSLKSAASSMTISGKKWGVPYTYYQWGIYYRADIFKKYNLKEPKTWAELLKVCETLKKNGVTPFAIGTKATWPTGGWFDYLNLRVNGYEFHMDLTAGKIPYTDKRVVKVFDTWDELVKPGYILQNHATYQWQEALPFMVQGKAAMYLMGNFAVAPLKEAGLTNDQLGFFQFPEITKGIPMAEDAPTDTLHIPKNAKNKADAKKFLAFLAKPEIQTEMNNILGQLPVNKNSKVSNDKFLTAGFKMLSNAYGLSQFYDRDAPADMAKAGMDGFQEYMVKPERKMEILKRLDQSFIISLYEWDGLSPKIYIGFQNYIELFSSDEFYAILINNLWWLGLFMLAPIFGLLIALYLNQKVFGIRLMKSLFFFPFVISQVVIGLVFSWFYDPSYGLLAKFLGIFGIPGIPILADEHYVTFGIIFAGMWPQIAYCMILYLTGLNNVNPELIEAGRIDGAKGFGMLWNVVLPQLRPATYIAITVTVIGALRSFDMISIMTQGGPFGSSRVLAYYMYEQALSEYGYRMGFGAAISVILFLIMMLYILYFLMHMYKELKVKNH
ncbi:hypothetical protein CHS0354_013119 [Potamilus streckersoni]|uniref:ABC transmembrane type-1 domain-containing protein n=1 Tax=Potamilus streckersoni TaxID=2493646 RepID=A0AAE0VQ70_9BIVA|nr:hypothetical protein CHS0354_013119 [Potamilus streckersoni]